MAPLAAVVPPMYVLVSVSEDDEEARLSNKRRPVETMEVAGVVLLAVPVLLLLSLLLHNREGDDNFWLFALIDDSTEPVVYLLIAPVVAPGLLDDPEIGVTSW